VRTALTSVDGIADIKTNPADRSCTFNAPKDLDVTATLNKIVEDGNRHIKDWALADGEEGE
jgi:copper chaperone CopZ